jgi:hypothetical protein
VQFYGNGGNSWIAIVAVLAVLAVRMLSTQRRRHGGRPGGPASSSGAVRGFTSPGSPSAGGTAVPPSATPGFTGTAAGWFVDPFVRHEQRYWSGAAWTEHVMDGGAPSIDPPPPPRPNG